MATIGQPLTSPEAGWKRYDDTAPQIIYQEIQSISESNFYKGTGKYIHSTNSTKVEFTFYGTKLRIISSVSSAYSATNPNLITIDNVTETYTQRAGSVGYQILVYEKVGLALGYHNVVISPPNGVPFAFDAIDIDDTGRLLHPDEVMKFKDLEVGKRIRCHYQAASNQLGYFNRLGEESSDFIPATSSNIPNGDFYWIMVEDWNGQKRLIADRNIQHSISWDTLNKAGVFTGKNIARELGIEGDIYLRSLTGGISATNLESEWDRYIVNSTLNGAITAGDNQVWNWNSGNLYSWTSSTNTQGAVNRTVRGHSSGVAVSSYAISNYIAQQAYRVGFRPMLVVEKYYVNQSFIFSGGSYMKWNGSSWITVSTSLPSAEAFINDGMDDLAVLTRIPTVITIPMDDNGTAGEVIGNGNGRIFREKINLKKYIDIRAIDIN